LYPNQTNKVMPKVQKFRILSPDGFDIRMDKANYTEKQVPQALEDFAKRYERQGYYSSTQYGRIPLEDIADYCSVVPID
jgi:hypothetical protein